MDVKVSKGWKRLAKKQRERNEGRTRIGSFPLQLRVMQFFLDFEFLEDRQYLAFCSFNSQDK